MGMVATVDRKWTADEVLALPDLPGRRFEVVEGELLVSPSPTDLHERAVFWLRRAITHYVAAAPRIGEALGPRSDAQLDDYTVVQPDVFVAPLVDGRRPFDRRDVRGFLLVVEVVSPGSQRTDRVIKRRRYQRAADEYWVVDTEARLIERWRAADDRPEILTETIAWHPAGREVPLVLELAALFREAFAEE